MNDKYSDEIEMYPDVELWLKIFLQERNLRSEVKTAIVHQKILSRYIQEKNLTSYFPDYQTYEIKVDIIATIKSQSSIKLAFVECKIDQITLKDISQLMGYCRVAKPVFSIILSPEGITSSVKYLFKTFSRYDVLEYQGNNKVIIATWKKASKSILIESVIPSGELNRFN